MECSNSSFKLLDFFTLEKSSNQRGQFMNPSDPLPLFAPRSFYMAPYQGKMEALVPKGECELPIKQSWILSVFP